MSENIFNDIGYDLIEKIAPPSLPVNNIIETSAPVSNTIQPLGGKKRLNIGLKIFGLGLVVIAGYKIWKYFKEKDDKKARY